jgi:Transposase domain (DUF772)
MCSPCGRVRYGPSARRAVTRLQSSRRLEREAGRNVEWMWLTGKLAPDFKTIADFRRDNGQAIRAVCPQFVLLCREIGLQCERTRRRRKTDSNPRSLSEGRVLKRSNTAEPGNQVCT